LRLARTVEHTTDVDGMLKRMTREQFNEWMAEFCIEPWGIEPQVEQEDKPSSIEMMRQMAGV
jgi:hypothetical protein